MKNKPSSCVLFITCLLPFAGAQSDEIVDTYPQWELPNAAKMRLGKGDINAIQFSPDGAQLAVATDIGVWLYDVKTGEDIFDSDDQGKIWLNGKQVFTHTKAFTAEIDKYTIPVTFKLGKNSILVKVCEEVGGWGFYLRITDTDGKPFDDLKINQ